MKRSCIFQSVIFTLLMLSSSATAQQYYFDDDDADSYSNAISTNSEYERDIDEYNRRSSYSDNQDTAYDNDTLYLDNQYSESYDNYENDTQDDYNYSRLVVRFHGSRVSIPLSSSIYWDLNYDPYLDSWYDYPDYRYGYAYPGSFMWDVYYSPYYYSWSRWAYYDSFYGFGWSGYWGWSRPYYGWGHNHHNHIGFRPTASRPSMTGSARPWRGNRPGFNNPHRPATWGSNGFSGFHSNRPSGTNPNRRPGASNRPTYSGNGSGNSGRYNNSTFPTRPSGQSRPSGRVNGNVQRNSRTDRNSNLPVISNPINNRTENNSQPIIRNNSGGGMSGGSGRPSGGGGRPSGGGRSRR